MKAFLSLTAPVTVLLMAALIACGAGDVQVQDSPGQLVAISITPSNPVMASRTTQQFTATGIYSNHTTRDITADATWNTSDTQIGIISNTLSSKGLATFTATGSITVTAMIGSISGSTAVTVTPASLVSIAVSPVQPSIPQGTGQQFTATGTYSDNSTQNLTDTVTWSSSNTSVASISSAAGSMGMALSAAPGSSTITATLGSISGTTTLTVTPATLVSITVTPANPSLARGTTRQFTATGIYSDNSTQNLTASATWSSSNTAVTAVSNAAGSKGAASALAVGTATIAAASGGISGSTTVTVTPAMLASIAVTPVNPNIARGTSRQFTATGTYSDNSTQNLTDTVAWYSSSTGIATISNAAGSRGMSTALATGSTLITAATASISGTTTLTVTPATLVSITVAPANSSLARGTTRQFTATGTYSDNSTQNLTASVTWSSANTAIAAISNAAGSQGSATALAAGSTAITATSGGVSASTTLTVTAATLVSITITPTNPSVAQGASQQFTATGTYSDSSTQNLTALATWSASSSVIASISNAAGSNGLATAIAPGTTTITAIYGSVSSSTAFTVTAAAPGNAALSWDVPVDPIDGSPITSGLGGYRIYYGNAPGNYTTTVDVGNITTWTIANLAPGTYYFVVTAYDTSGIESGYSNEVSKVII